MRTRLTGFTLVELIVIMTIIGILAVTALPRFFDRQTYDARAFYDQTVAILRYAQKTAIAQRRLVCATFGGNSVTLTIATTYPEDPADSCNNNPLSGPSGAAPYSVTASGGVTINSPTTPFSINFTASGRPTTVPSSAIKITGTDTSITVEPETGYVH